MARLAVLFVFAAGLAACTARAESQAAPAIADLLLTNATVVTVNDALPHAEAVAIRADRIVAVGSAGSCGDTSAPAPR